jgi:hypothetical protein
MQQVIKIKAKRIPSILYKVEKSKPNFPGSSRGFSKGKTWLGGHIEIDKTSCPGEAVYLQDQWRIVSRGKSSVKNRKAD